LEIGHHRLGLGQSPLERKGIDAPAVSGAGALRDGENGNDVEGVFEAAAEKAGTVRLGEHEAKPPAEIEDAVVRLAAADAVAAAGPDLPFVAALDRAGLCA